MTQVYELELKYHLSEWYHPGSLHLQKVWQKLSWVKVMQIVANEHEIVILSWLCLWVKLSLHHCLLAKWHKCSYFLQDNPIIIIHDNAHCYGIKFKQTLAMVALGGLGSWNTLNIYLIWILVISTGFPSLKNPLEASNFMTLYLFFEQ